MLLKEFAEKLVRNFRKIKKLFREKFQKILRKSGDKR